MKNWYCYVCGKKLLKNYCLVSMRNSTDRVFLVHKKCSKQVEAIDVIIQEIKETNFDRI